MVTYRLNAYTQMDITVDYPICEFVRQKKQNYFDGFIETWSIDNKFKKKIHGFFMGRFTTVPCFSDDEPTKITGTVK